MEAGFKVPGYQIKGEIGRGGMATVYRALQESLGRDVALKVMNMTLVADESFKKRFLNEGRIVAQLSHPNIVTIHDIGAYQQYYYLAMELLDDETLRDRIDRGMSTKEAVSTTKVLAKALGYAHERGFIHRDIKPLNVMFRSDGAPVLTDFGIAKTLGDSTQMTAAGYTLGSVGYMSPEQSLGKPLDNRSDLYSLGVLLWEMLTGSTPFEADDAFALALKHATDPIPQLPAESAHLQPAIDKLLAKEADNRFANAEQCRVTLKALMWQPDDSGPRPVTALQPTEDSGPQTVLLSESQAAAAAAPPSGATETVVAPRPKARSGATVAWIAGTLGVFVLAVGAILLAPRLSTILPDAAPNSAQQPKTATVVPATAPKPVADPQPKQPPPQPVARQQEPAVQPVAEPESEPEEPLVAVVTEPDPPPIETSATASTAPIGTTDTGEDPEPTPKPAAVETASRTATSPAEEPADTPAERQQREVESLLARARQQEAALRFYQPADDNAFETYRKVLTLDPLNDAARAGLLAVGRVRLGDTYRARAEKQLDAGDIQDSLATVEKGLKLAPGHNALQQLRERIVALPAGRN